MSSHDHVHVARYVIVDLYVINDNNLLIDNFLVCPVFVVCVSFCLICAYFKGSRIFIWGNPLLGKFIPIFQRVYVIVACVYARFGFLLNYDAPNLLKAVASIKFISFVNNYCHR